MNTVVNIPSSAPHSTAPHGAETERVNATRGEQSAQADRAHRSRSQMRAMPEPGVSHSPFLPVLLGSLALLGWLGFQTQQLLNERQTLQGGYASQQQTVDNAGKLRVSLDALAADTQRMADGGNPNAKLLVDELRKRGITISTAATSSTGAVTPSAR
jgi:hypothetical protein